MDDNIRHRLMGMMAVEKRLITEKQLRALLNVFDFDGTPMMTTALEKGFLTEAQVEKLGRLVERDASEIVPADYSKKKFGQLALECRAVTKEQLKECLLEQREFAALGACYTVGQLLMSRDYITPEQVTAMLAEQGKRFLQCTEFCDGSDTVRNFSDEEFYLCPKCGADLEPAEIVSISRKKIEEEVAELRAKAGPAAGAAAPKPKPRPKIKIDLSSVEFDDEDDDDLDEDVGDLDVLEL